MHHLISVNQSKLNVPHVEVAGDPQAVAISGKVIPPVHINPKHLVGHNLTGKVITNKDSILQIVYERTAHTSNRNFF